MTHQKEVGVAGEQFVCAHLAEQGFTIVAKNYTTRTGEIDIIATKGELLAFVEVKTRMKDYFPLQTVITQGKRRRMVSAAKYYMLKNGPIDKVCRFDVAFVEYRNDKFEIEYIPNAFQSR